MVLNWPNKTSKSEDGNLTYFPNRTKITLPPADQTVIEEKDIIDHSDNLGKIFILL